MSQPSEELDPAIRTLMEHRFESDFSDVRIHHGSQAAASAQALRSRAYTVGSHIVFASSIYDPTSAEGQRILAHELAHVMQQRRGPVSGLPIGDDVTVSQPDDSFEQAAEKKAQGIMAGLAGSGTPPASKATSGFAMKVARLSIQSAPETENAGTQVADAGTLIAAVGGPYHPPVGTELSCSMDDDCSTISTKINYLKHTIRTRCGAGPGVEVSSGNGPPG